MNTKRSISKYIIAYLLWFISVTLGLLTLNLGRETLLMGVTVSGAGITDSSEAFYQSLRAGTLAQWSWMVVGLIAIALLVGFEHLYRTSVPDGSLWKRFFLVTGIEAAILLVIHSIYYALAQTFRPVGWMNITILVVEALTAGLFFWLWSTQRRMVAYEQP